MKKKITAKKLFFVMFYVFLILTIIFSSLTIFKYNVVYFSLAVTFGTFLYHFAMRLIIGKIIWHNFNYKNFWFRPKKFENKFYKAIKIKKWKDKMPSYNPEGYLITVTSLDEIIETMCRNEVIHEVIALLSYVPLLFTLFAGEFWVFFVTSIIASLFDLIFVILQRYNRPRLIRLKEKQMKRGKLQ